MLLKMEVSKKKKNCERKDTYSDLGRLAISTRLFPSFNSLCNRAAARQAIYSKFVSAGIPSS